MSGTWAWIWVCDCGKMANHVWTDKDLAFVSFKRHGKYCKKVYWGLYKMNQARWLRRVRPTKLGEDGIFLKLRQRKRERVTGLSWTFVDKYLRFQFLGKLTEPTT